jgi:plasmid stabilization system protein ParE
MNFKVQLTEQAEAELAEVYEWIAADSPEQAAIWFNGLVEVSESLSTNPERCPRAPESNEIDREIRQLLYGKYRILFTIREDTVYLLHVRHGAMRHLLPDEV